MNIKCVYRIIEPATEYLPQQSFFPDLINQKEITPEQLLLPLYSVSVCGYTGTPIEIPLREAWKREAEDFLAHSQPQK